MIDLLLSGCKLNYTKMMSSNLNRILSRISTCSIITLDTFHVHDSSPFDNGNHIDDKYVAYNVLRLRDAYVYDMHIYITIAIAKQLVSPKDLIHQF